jgi:hypothetical protein
VIRERRTLLSQIHIKTVIVAFIVTLGILLCGYYFYNNYYVKNGLHEQISQVVEVEEEIEIAEQKHPPTVYIRLSEIKALQDVYLKIEEIVCQKLGSEYRIVLLDERNDKLMALYDKCSFVIQESLVTGKFQDMYNKVQELAELEGVECHLTMDSSNIYLELRDDQGYLYEVIPRLNQLGSLEKPGSENN